MKSEPVLKGRMLREREGMKFLSYVDPSVPFKDGKADVNQILVIGKNGRVVGRTGFVETKDGGARLFIGRTPDGTKSRLDISVTGVEQHSGVGTEMMRDLIGLAREKKLTRLSIVGAVPSAVPFYEKALNNLKESGHVVSFSKLFRKDMDDYCFSVKI